MAIFLIFFFMFTNFGIPNIERRKKKRNLLVGQPQGSLSERIDTVFICIDLKLLFLVACLLISLSGVLRLPVCVHSLCV